MCDRVYDYVNDISPGNPNHPRSGALSKLTQPWITFCGFAVCKHPTRMALRDNAGNT